MKNKNIKNIGLQMYSYEETLKLMKLAFEQGFKKADVVETGLEGKETEEECRWILAKHKLNE